MKRHANTHAHTVVLARYYAQQAIKEQWKAEGKRPVHIEVSELYRAANDYLQLHEPELFAKARATLERFARRGKL